MMKLRSNPQVYPQPSERGFTLIELLVAMAVFSFMLMIVATGFIQVVRVHQSGIASRTTQQNTRLVMDAIMKDVRAGSVAYIGGTAPLQWICLAKGSQALEYAVDGNGNLRSAVIPLPSKLSDCLAYPAGLPTTSWKTLNDTTVQTTQFALSQTTQVSPGRGTVTVNLTMASLNNTQTMNAAKTACVPGPGSQFCAVTTLSSSAALKGGDGS